MGTCEEAGPLSPRILHTCHDAAARFLHLLGSPGCNYLVQEDFIPFLQVRSQACTAALLPTVGSHVYTAPLPLLCCLQVYTTHRHVHMSLAALPWALLPGKMV